MKPIFITGHTGFLGSHLVDSISESYSITGFSKSLKKGMPIKQIKKNLLEIERKDIKKNSVVIHFAAISDFMFCEKFPMKCFDINVLGTQKLLEISRKNNCDFIFLSTSHVYGNPHILPLFENHPRNGTSIYSSSKLASEIQCESYAKTYGMNVSIIRLFSAFGPRNPSHLVLSKIISQALHKNSIKIGNLFPKRDFIYVDDVISAIKLILLNMNGFNVYNIGSGQSHSIETVCKKIQKLCKITKPIMSTKNSIRKNDIPEIKSDITTMKKLGWKPTVSFENGLKKTIDWYLHK